MQNRIATQEYLVREIRTVKNEIAHLIKRKNELIMQYRKDREKISEDYQLKLLQANLTANLRTLSASVRKKDSRLKDLTTKLDKKTQ